MITDKDVEKLKDNATEFASMMEEHEIEQMIAAFVEEKNLRTKSRRKHTKW